MHFVTMISDLQLVAASAMAWFASSGETCARTAATTLVTSRLSPTIALAGRGDCVRTGDLPSDYSTDFGGTSVCDLGGGIWSSGGTAVVGAVAFRSEPGSCKGRCGFGSDGEFGWAVASTGCAVGFDDCGTLGRGFCDSRNKPGGALDSAATVVEGRAPGGCECNADCLTRRSAL